MSAWLHRVWMALRLARLVRAPWKVATRHWSHEPVTEVVLRRGLIIRAAAEDSLIVMLLEVMNDRCYTHLLAPDSKGVVIDAGANIGVAAIGFLAHSPDLEVHAYEPHPTVRERLMSNLEHADSGRRVRVFDEAVSMGSGQAWLAVPGQSMDSHLVSSMGQSPSVPVSTVGLDEVLARAGTKAVALLKLDIEGAEAPALEAVTPHSFERVERCAIEYHDDILPQSRERCERRLQQFGMRTWQKPLSPGRGYLYGSRD